MDDANSFDNMEDLPLHTPSVLMIFMLIKKVFTNKVNIKLCKTQLCRKGVVGMDCWRVFKRKNERRDELCGESWREVMALLKSEAMKKLGGREGRRQPSREVCVCVHERVCVARWLQRVATSQRNRCRSHDQPLPRRW